MWQHCFLLTLALPDYITLGIKNKKPRFSFCSALAF
jgi:hypothetical protein